MRYSRLIFLAFFGLLTGISVAIFRITHWTGGNAIIKNGPWRGHDLSEVGKDNLLTARIAVAALFALRPDESLYLIAREDDEGMPLSSNDDYIITGIPLASRYWSITIYGEDYFLIPNEEGRFNFNMSNLKYESDSSFAIQVSSGRKPGNWLPSGLEGKFYLALRLYHPEKELRENIGTVQLPSIKKIR